MEYVGEVICDEECKRRRSEMEEKGDTNFYFLSIDKHRVIDAKRAGNKSRFMNHSCDPNCELQKWIINGATRIGLFAVREIALG